MFHLSYSANGFTWFLRGTVWTSDKARADSFASESLALAAIAKGTMAHKTTRPEARKAARAVSI